MQKLPPLWFRDLEYPYEQIINKPEGQDENGITLEVPFDSERMAIDPLDRKPPSYVWYKCPMEIFDQGLNGFRLNPAIFTGGREDSHHPSPVVQTEIQDAVAVTPFLVLPSCKRTVAGIYHCVRKTLVDGAVTYKPIAKFTVVINNVQQEHYSLEGDQILITAPVTADAVVKEAVVVYRWIRHRYPTPDLMARVTSSLSSAVKKIRTGIESGDANPFESYLTIPAHSREVSLILCGYDIDGAGEIKTSRPLPELPEFNDLRDIRVRLMRGYAPFIGQLGEEFNRFIDLLVMDVVRLYTGDLVFRHITLGATGLRSVLIRRITAETHQGLYTCETLSGVSSQLRKLYPNLPEGYGENWIPCATLRLHVLDSRTTNRKSPEFTASVYSLHGSKIPAVTILDVKDATKQLEMALVDAPAQFSGATKNARISWHLELIPSSGEDILEVPVLDKHGERGLDQETRFLRQVVANLNSLSISKSSTRYLFSRYISKPPAEENKTERYSLPVTARTFSDSARETLDIIRAAAESVPRGISFDAPASEFESLFSNLKMPGYTAVFSAFLEAPDASGLSHYEIDASRNKESDQQLISNAVQQRLVKSRLEAAGLDRQRLLKAVIDLSELVKAEAKSIEERRDELAEEVSRRGEVLPVSGATRVREPNVDSPDYDYEKRVYDYVILLGLHERNVRSLELCKFTLEQVFSGPDKSAAKDYRLASEYYSRTEKPLLGVVAFQYGLDQRSGVLQQRIGALLSNQSLITAEFLAESSRARAIIESNISVYEPMIKELLANRRVAAAYADSLIKRAPRDLSSALPAVLERYLVEALKNAAENPKTLLSIYHLRPLSYGPPANPLNSAGFDAAWREDPSLPDQRSNYTFITPLASGEGIALFPNNTTEGSTLTPEGIAWIVMCFREHSSLIEHPPRVLPFSQPELVRRPDSRTANVVVQFMSDDSNSAAFVGLVSAQRHRSVRQNQRAQFEDFKVVCATLHDLRGVNEEISLTDEPLSLFLRAIQNVSVQDDDFSSKRYRRLLGALMMNKLGRLASLINVTGYYTSNSSLPTGVFATDQEALSREFDKRSSFDPQAFVTVQTLSGIENVIQKLLSTQEYNRKLSGQDQAFLSAFFRVPQPPTSVTQLDDTPTLVTLPGADTKDASGRTPAVSRLPEEVAPDLLRRRPLFPVPEAPGDDSTPTPPPFRPSDGSYRTPAPLFPKTPTVKTPSRRPVPGLDDPPSPTTPVTPPSAPPPEDDLVRQLTKMFASLNVRESDRVGEARYNRPDRKPAAQITILPGAAAQQPFGDVPVLFAEDKYRLTKSDLTNMISASMERNRKYLEGRVQRLRDRLGMNIEVIRSLASLKYASEQDKRDSEILRGALLAVFEESLKRSEEVIDDAFEPLNKDTPNRVANEIRKRSLRRFNDDPESVRSKATIAKVVDDITASVYSTVEKELEQVDVKFVLKQDPQRLREISDSLAVLIKTFVEVRQQGDGKPKSEALDLVAAVRQASDLRKSVAELDLLLKTAPSSLPQETSRRLRNAVESIKAENITVAQTLQSLRKDCDEALLLIRKRIFDVILARFSPSNDPNASEGMSAKSLVDKIQELVQAEYLDSSKAFASPILESVAKRFRAINELISKTPDRVARWKKIVADEVKTAEPSPQPLPAAPSINPQELGRLRGDLQKFLEGHRVTANAFELSNKSSEGAQNTLRALTTDVQDALAHIKPADTIESLSERLAKFKAQFMETFWTDKAIVFLLAESLKEGEPMVEEFRRVIYEQYTLPGRQFMFAVLQMLEQGKENVIRVLSEEFVRNVTRALARVLSIPNWANEPIIPDLAPLLLDEARKKNAETLVRLTNEVFQFMRAKLVSITTARGNDLFEFMTSNMVSLLEISPQLEVAALNTNVVNITKKYITSGRVKGVCDLITGEWIRLLDALSDATRESHSHLLPWSSVPNTKFSVKKNPRLSGVCSLETFCHISDGNALSTVFSMAGSLIESENERAELILTQGLVAALEQKGGDSSTRKAEEDARPFTQLIRESTPDLQAGRLPLSILLSRSRPVDLLTPAAILVGQVIPLLARGSSNRARGMAVIDWQTELSLLGVYTRKILIEALLSARTEVARERVFPILRAQEPPMAPDSILSITDNIVAIFERVLTKNIVTLVDYLTREDNVAPPLIPDEDFATSSAAFVTGPVGLKELRDYYPFYISSIRNFLVKKGLRRIPEYASSFSPQLSNAPAAGKKLFAASCVAAFAQDTLRLYVAEAQAVFQPNQRDQDTLDRVDLSEEFVRQVLDQLNIVPNHQHSVLFTGEDVQRFFGGTAGASEELAAFIDRHVICGSNRLLMTGRSAGTWSVLLRGESGTWQRVSPVQPEENKRIDARSTESFTVPATTGGDTSTLSAWIFDLLKGAEFNSKTNILHPFPSILVNGSLVLDFMRKLDELITTRDIASRPGTVLMRQLGFSTVLPPMTTVRPSDELLAPSLAQQPVPAINEEPDEVLSAGSILTTATPVAKVVITPASAPPSPKIAADVITLLERIQQARVDAQTELDKWMSLYNTFSAQLSLAVKTLIDESTAQTREQIQTFLAGVLSGFSTKSDSVRKPLSQELKSTEKYASLLVKIQENKTKEVTDSPALVSLKNVEANELRNLRDLIAASSVKTKEFEASINKWVLNASNRARSTFGTSKALKDALDRSKRLDKSLLSGIQSVGASSGQQQ